MKLLHSILGFLKGIGTFVLCLITGGKYKGCNN